MRRRSPVAAWVPLAVGLAWTSQANLARADGNASWATETVSPAPIGAAGLSDLERAVLARCGPGERGLRQTAERLLAVKLEGGSLPDLDAIAFAQRAAGEPHTWARAWAASGSTLERDATLRKLDAWLATDRALLRRCGVALGGGRNGAGNGRSVIVAVSVDALADLAPLPTEARVGQWLTVDARLRVPAHGGRVIVLGPEGSTQVLLTSFDGSHLRARFAPDRAGAFAVQVTADVEGGPRPVLEATVFADVAPLSSWNDESAPGEDAGQAAADDGAALAAMVSAARAWADRPPVTRDARLDALACDHARAMMQQRELAHDAGDGDPVGRVHAAGFSPAEMAENVAHAGSVTLAQRALWASPSHRADMLRRDFDRVGVGVARDEQGGAWVVELFAAGL